MPMYSRDQSLARMVKNDQEGISSREIRMNKSIRERDIIHFTGKCKLVEMTGVWQKWGKRLKSY